LYTFKMKSSKKLKPVVPIQLSVLIPPCLVLNET